MVPPPNTPKSPAAVLRATYTSSTQQRQQHTFTHPLISSTHTDGTLAKTAYLSELRAAVSVLQDQVNVFLTTKMQEDRLGVGERDGGDERDLKEEENYGEEVVDDDDS